MSEADKLLKNLLLSMNLDNRKECIEHLDALKSLVESGGEMPNNIDTRTALGWSSRYEIVVSTF